MRRGDAISPGAESRLTLEATEIRCGVSVNISDPSFPRNTKASKNFRPMRRSLQHASTSLFPPRRGP